MKELTTKQYQALWAIPDVHNIEFGLDGRIEVWFATIGGMNLIRPGQDIDEAIVNISKIVRACLKINAPRPKAPESHAALINAMRFV